MLKGLGSALAIALLAGVAAQVLASERGQSFIGYQEWQQQYFSRMPLVQDAIRRWTAKTGMSDRAMEGRHIEMMRFPTKVCVQLSLTGPAVGGVPVYCYKVEANLDADEFELIEEYSDVE